MAQIFSSGLRICCSGRLVTHRSDVDGSVTSTPWLPSLLLVLDPQQRNEILGRERRERHGFIDLFQKDADLFLER